MQLSSSGLGVDCLGLNACGLGLRNKSELLITAPPLVGQRMEKLSSV